MVAAAERCAIAPADPELFAGLVMACRFCGLLDASLAADEHARRLDPGIRTSVMYTHFMRGDWERAIESDVDDMRFCTKDVLPFVSGEEEAIAAWREMEATPLPARLRMAVRGNRFALEGNREALVQVMAELARGRWDPEAMFIGVRNFARVGATDLALDALESVVTRGFYCPTRLRARSLARTPPRGAALS